MARLPLANLHGAKGGDAAAGRRLLLELAHLLRHDKLSNSERELLATMLERLAGDDKLTARRAAAESGAKRGRSSGISADYYGIVTRLRMLAYQRTGGETMKIAPADKKAFLEEAANRGIEPKTIDRAVRYVEEAEQDADRN